MIQKIKELVHATENIEIIKTKIDELSGAFVGMQKEAHDSNEELRILKSELKELKDVHSELINSVQPTVDGIKALRHDLEYEIKEFKLVKGQLQEKLFQRIREELNENITTNLEGLKTDVSRYNELKQQVGSITSRIGVLGTEIDKFNTISKQLKEGDFELSNYAKKIMEMDHEKLQLLRKIDVLERLVSKERRFGR